MAQIAQGLKGRVLRKKFVLPRGSWFFIFFPLFFLLMVLHDIILNVTITIYFKTFYDVHSVEVLSQDLLQAKKFYVIHTY
jgi:hypothetical protein